MGLKSRVLLCGVILFIMGILGYWVSIKCGLCEDNSQKYIEDSKQLVEKSIDKIKSKF